MKKDMLVMAMLMNGNNNNANNPLGSMLPLLMMGEGKDDEDMLPLLMMMSNNGANTGFNPMMLMAMSDGNSDFPPEMLMGDPCVTEISLIHNFVVSKPKLKALATKLYLDVLKKHNKINKTTMKYLTHNRIDLLKNYLSLGIEDNVDTLHSVDEV